MSIITSPFKPLLQSCAEKSTCKGFACGHNPWLGYSVTFFEVYHLSPCLLRPAIRLHIMWARHLNPRLVLYMIVKWLIELGTTSEIILREERTQPAAKSFMYHIYTSSLVELSSVVIGMNVNFRWFRISICCIIKIEKAIPVVFKTKR